MTVANRRSRPLFWCALAVFVALIIALLYLALVAARGGVAYYRFKIEGHAWIGEMWQQHPSLGYAHVPGFMGEQSIADDFSITVRIDEGGFRVPAVDRPSNARPLVLALGDSNTFGQACEVEDTYAFLVGQELHGTTRNAGVSGWGVAQMVIRAEELIPRLKPDVVLALYDDWLMIRSQLGFSESQLAAVPTPYFVEDGRGGLSFQRPFHDPLVFGMGLERYWAVDPGVGDFVSFVFRAAIPLLVHNDWTRAQLWLQWKTGLRPAPTDDVERIAKVAYTRLAELSQENGATLVIVSWPTQRNAMLEALPGVIVSYPRRRAWARLPEGATLDDFSHEYRHWRGSPPVLLDGHPNPLEHSLVVEDVLAVLRAAGKLDTSEHAAGPQSP